MAGVEDFHIPIKGLLKDAGNFANEFGSHPQNLCDFCDKKAPERLMSRKKG